MRRPDVAAVVIAHGVAPMIDRCLASVAPQVGELLVVQNVEGAPPPHLPPGSTLVSPAREQGFAANANLGIDRTRAPYVLVLNPDVELRADAVSVLATFLDARPRCGIAGPRLEGTTGDWQPSRRRFPTVLGTVVRRTPLRLLLRPHERQRAHYLLDERPSEPVPADWMLGACLLLRRAMLEAIGPFDPGYRLYGEDIELCYRAANAGWERWYVPGAGAVHEHQRITDRSFLTRRTIWHWRGILRFVRTHPERLRALR